MPFKSMFMLLFLSFQQNIRICFLHNVQPESLFSGLEEGQGWRRGGLRLGGEERGRYGRIQSEETVIDKNKNKHEKSDNDTNKKRIPNFLFELHIYV